MIYISFPIKYRLIGGGVERKTKKCSQCGEVHLLENLELSFKRPDAVIELNDDERKQLVKESDDLCTIDWERYFVRAVLPLPVETRNVRYNLGVWVEVDETAFRLIVDHWDDPSQNLLPPLDACLANDIPSLDNTRGLKIKLHLTGPTSRPSITVPPSSHPLHYEQWGGITEHRAAEYTDYFA
jgi:hypothetical protein